MNFRVMGGGGGGPEGIDGRATDSVMSGGAVSAGVGGGGAEGADFGWKRNGLRVASAGSPRSRDRSAKFTSAGASAGACAPARAADRGAALPRRGVDAAGSLMVRTTTSATT